MTNKEKEKFYYNSIKQESKKYSWKFKTHFTYKVIQDLYFTSYFYVVPKENKIYGWLAFKPFSLDDLFWEITDSKENSKLPISFRGEAAFKIASDSIYEFNVTINNEDKPETEINILLSEIENKIAETEEKYPTIEKFLEKQYENEKTHSLGILTILIKLEKYEEAKNKITEFRNRKINSGYSVGNKDYYDLFEEYCVKKTKKNNSFIQRIFNT